MVVRSATVVVREDKVTIITWAGLLNGDTGQSVRMSRYADKTVQTFGTLGPGGTVTMEGGADNATWGKLHDPQGIAIAIQDVDPVQVEDNPDFVRPNITAGDGTTNLTVVITAVAKGP